MLIVLGLPFQGSGDDLGSPIVWVRFMENKVVFLLCVIGIESKSHAFDTHMKCRVPRRVTGRSPDPQSIQRPKSPMQTEPSEFMKIFSGLRSVRSGRGSGREGEDKAKVKGSLVWRANTEHTRTSVHDSLIVQYS